MAETFGKILFVLLTIAVGRHSGEFRQNPDLIIVAVVICMLVLFGDKIFNYFVQRKK